MMNLRYKTLFFILIASAFIMANAVGIAAETKPAKKKKYTELSEEQIIAFVKKHPVNQKVKAIKCDFEKLEKFFDDYKYYFGNSWDEIKQKHKCEDVMKFCMEKEKKRWTFNLDIVTPEDGIQTGNLILYGHYIKPPYKVEVDYDKEKLFINNVELGSVKLPRVVQPKRERTEKEKASSEIFAASFEIDHQEKKLRKAYKKKLLIMFEEWKKKYDEERARRELEEELEDLKRQHFIYDYWIYDEKEPLFELKFFYTDEYWDIPREYLLTPEQLAEHKKLHPESFYPPEKLKKWKEELRRRSLTVGYNSIIKTLESKTTINLDSVSHGEPNYFFHTFKEVLLALFSNGSEYQKIVFMDHFLMGIRGEYAKEILFNYNAANYVFMFNKFVERGDINYE